MKVEAMPTGEMPKKKAKRGGAEAPIISLDQPGRLRTRHLLALFAISRATLYVRLGEGSVPKQDGYDGRYPYWNTSTIRAALEG